MSRGPGSPGPETRGPLLDGVDHSLNAKRGGARSRADTRIWMLTAAIAVSGALLDLPEPSGIFPLHWWAIALGFAAAEMYPIHTQFGKNVHSRSLSELPMVLGFFSLAPLAFVLCN